MVARDESMLADLYTIAEQAIGGRKVRSPRREWLIPNSRRPRPEIRITGKLLCNERGTDESAMAHDQAAGRRGWKEHCAYDAHHSRVKEPGERCERQEQAEGGKEESSHVRPV